MALQRIDKILSSQGIASRSEIKQLIKAGRITANGTVVRRPEEKYDPENSTLTLDGKPLRFQKYLYIMMNKPGGVLSASTDKHAKTVIDLLPRELYRRDLFPAGRLDKDTEGFILITNDGSLAHKMLSPKSHVYKRYEVETDRELRAEDETAFRQGIVCGELHFLPAEMKIIGKNRALVEICEGKFHQVKKMFSSVGAEVVFLKRLKIGGVSLDEKLAPGACRELEEHEIIDILSLKHGIVHNI